MDSKQELRKQLKKQAKLVRSTDFSAEDNLSCKALLESSYYEHATWIYAFVPLDSEVDMRLVLEHAVKNKSLALPVCEENGTLTFYQVTNLSSLHVGKYGILEPQKEKIVVPSTESLLLVPALAYTSDHERLGRGKGYYDRYLALYPDTMSIGLCRLYQLLENIPTEPWDCKVDTVLCAGIFY